VQQPAEAQVAKRVRAQRAALGLTQGELAGELGVTHQHISRIESGHAAPSLALLVKLSRRLGLSTDHLLTGKDPAPTETAGAIRANKRLTSAAKRHLIAIVTELEDEPAAQK
jgi:transcriptional regulator with XRE-family HTH domain